MNTANYIPTKGRVVELVDTPVMNYKGSITKVKVQSLVLGTTSKKITCTAVLLFFNSNTFFLKSIYAQLQGFGGKCNRTIATLHRCIQTVRKCSHYV